MLLSFTIKEYPELFTVADYKQVLKNVKDHFADQCSKQGINIVYSYVYYNPEENRGIIDYKFGRSDIMAYIAQMDFPIPNDYLTITFD